jgi:hypothetical protein
MLLVFPYGPGLDKITRDQIDVLLNTTFKKTLGALLKDIEKEADFPNELMGELRIALKHRNYLTHNYFWESCVDFNTDKGRDQMLSELLDYTEHFENTDKRLQGLIKNWRDKVGITDEQVNDLMEKAIIGEIELD